jgi:hypothetical protein
MTWAGWDEDMIQGKIDHLNDMVDEIMEQYDP